VREWSRHLQELNSKKRSKSFILKGFPALILTIE
jgi:hypothetical protein